MALTISQQPQMYTPAYNDQTFRALSNQIAVSDFKYIVTVQVNGGSIFTYDILQRPDGYLIYDPIEIVKNYIDRSYFNPRIYQAGSYGLATGKAAEVEVKIKEYYSGSIQSTSTIVYVAWDACLKNDDFFTFNYTSYVLDTGIIFPLSITPNVYPTININGGDYFMHFFRNNATVVTLRLYDEDNLIVGTADINLNTGSDLIHYIDVGANSIVALGMLAPADNWNVLVDIKDSISNVLYSERIYFKDECTKFTPYGLFYLTRAGKIDYMDFNLISQVNVNKKTTSTRLGSNKNGASSYGRNIWDAEKFTVSTQTVKKITLNTDWITEAQSTQLEELFDSPIYFLKDYEKNRYKAVDLIDSDYKISKHENESLFNYTINCEYSTQETRQRGI